VGGEGGQLLDDALAAAPVAGALAVWCGWVVGFGVCGFRVEVCVYVVFGVGFGG